MKTLLTIIMIFFNTNLLGSEIGFLIYTKHFNMDIIKYDTENNKGIYIEYNNIIYTAFNNSFNTTTHGIGYSPFNIKLYRNFNFSCMFGFVYGYAIAKVNGNWTYNDPNKFGGKDVLPYIVPTLSYKIINNYNINLHVPISSIVLSISRTL